MKLSVHRMFAGIAASLAFALPAAAQVSVVGCLYDSTAPQINDDPNRCPADNKLDIVSIKTSWTQPASTGGTGSGAGKVQIGPFVIVKNLDRTSPTLFRDVVTGRHLRGALIVVYDTDFRGRLRRVFTFLLEEVLVSSLEFDAADSRARNSMPMDLVTLGYDRITVRDDATNSVQQFDAAQNLVQ